MKTDDIVTIVGRPKGSEPPKVNVGTRLPRDLYDWIAAYADREARTVSQVVLFAVQEFRERHEQRGRRKD